jgi:hypothetical protein
MFGFHYQCRPADRARTNDCKRAELHKTVSCIARVALFSQARNLSHYSRSQPARRSPSYLFVYVPCCSYADIDLTKINLKGCRQPDWNYPPSVSPTTSIVKQVSFIIMANHQSSARYSSLPGATSTRYIPGPHSILDIG